MHVVAPSRWGHLFVRGGLQNFMTSTSVNFMTRKIAAGHGKSPQPRKFPYRLKMRGGGVAGLGGGFELRGPVGWRRGMRILRARRIPIGHPNLAPPHVHMRGTCGARCRTCRSRVRSIAYEKAGQCARHPPGAQGGCVDWAMRRARTNRNLAETSCKQLGPLLFELRVLVKSGRRLARQHFCVSRNSESQFDNLPKTRCLALATRLPIYFSN